MAPRCVSGQCLTDNQRMGWFVFVKKSTTLVLGVTIIDKILSSMQEVMKNSFRCDRCLNRTPLFWSSTRNHSEITKHLLSQNQIQANIGKSTNNATPLYQASKNGLLEIVGFLLKHSSIDINSATLDRQTPLMAASMNGNTEVAEEILSDVNIDVNYATFDGKTALIHAVSMNHYKIFELLIRCPRVNSNLMDEEYKSAVNLAQEMKDIRFMKSFENRGILQITKGHTCCSSAINRGLFRAVTSSNIIWINRFLVCPQIDINIRNKEGYTSLNLATEKGLKRMVGIFLNFPKIDVNKPNSESQQNALIIASDTGNVHIVRLLLLHSQTYVNEKNAYGDSALSVASKKYRSLSIRKYFRIVKLLLRCSKTKALEENYHNDIKQIVDLSSAAMIVNPSCCHKVRDKFLRAAWIGDFKAIRGLLECPDSALEVNAVDNKGRTPLYIASMMGHLEAVEVLVSNKNVTAEIGRFLDGYTAFSVSSENAHFNVMRSLIQNGQSDMAKGWCTDEWVHPCKVEYYSPNETKLAPEAAPIPSQLIFNIITQKYKFSIERGRTLFCRVDSTGFYNQP